MFALRTVLTEMLIVRLSQLKAEVQRGFGGYGTGIRDVFVYIKTHHPDPDSVTMQNVEESLISLHARGQVHLQIWNGNGFSPWRPDWHGFFRAFRLLPSKP
jgi:hypothetical protein